MIWDDLEKCGVDTKQVIARFAGQAALCEKFIYKFADDVTFSNLMQAAASKDYEEILTAAHTLKGVSSNLGMDKLADACHQTVQKLRADDQEIEADIAAIEAAYQEMVAVILSNRDA